MHNIQSAVSVYFLSMFGLTVYLISDSVSRSPVYSVYSNIECPGGEADQRETTESLDNSEDREFPGLPHSHPLLTGFLQQGQVSARLKMENF